QRDCHEGGDGLDRQGAAAPRRGPVGGLLGAWAGASDGADRLLELVLQPGLELVIPPRATHLSEGTPFGSHVPDICIQARRSCSRALAAARREATVRS